jgi:Protein of unknown function (DUF2586)
MIAFLHKILIVLLTTAISMDGHVQVSKLPPLTWHNDVTTVKHRVTCYNNLSKYALFLMVVIPNINVTRTTGGLGRLATITTGYSGLVTNGVAVSGGAQLGTTYQLNSLNDALALGLTPAYDAANTVLVNYHISEFFRMAPSGRLYLRMVAQSVSLTSMSTNSAGHAVWDLLNDPLCAGQLRQVGVCLNPASGYTPTVTAQMNTDVIAVSSGTYSGAAVNLQSLANIQFGKHAPVRFFLEARNFGGTTGSLINAAGSLCNNVQLVMFADNDVSTAETLYGGHAAVGTALGLRANLQIQQSMAYVAVGNLQNATTGTNPVTNGGCFVNPGLSNGALLSTFTVGYTVNGSHTTGDDDNILTAGFMSVVLKPNYPGVYINNDITATTTSDDYYNGPNGLVVNEASRIMYQTMIPNLNQDVNINTANGQLDINLVKNWEAELNLAGRQNLAYAVSTTNGVPGIKYIIDPNQDVLTNDTITVQIQIVPKGYASTINEYIGLTNPYVT